MKTDNIISTNFAAEANTIPPEELDIIRIKMGKSKRKEAD